MLSYRTVTFHCSQTGQLERCHGCFELVAQSSLDFSKQKSIFMQTRSWQKIHGETLFVSILLPPQSLFCLNAILDAFLDTAVCSGWLLERVEIGSCLIQ